MKRNKFSLSHFRMQTLKMGQLVPLSCYEVLPGDTVQQSISLFLRCSPLVVPPMHPVHVRVHCFFVPNRIIWQGSNPIGSSATGGWENFITGGPDGMDTTVHPYIHLTTWGGHSTLFDYLGLPNNAGAPAGGSVNISALPVRAYQLIWNEYYRDQDLQTAATVSTADGADTTTSTSIQNVAWQKDYYTTARPFAFKGPALAVFPAGSTAPVTGIGIGDGVLTAVPNYRDSTGAVVSSGAAVGTANAAAVMQTTGSSGTNTGASNFPKVLAQLGLATGGADINGLRRQFALMRFQEARMRYGSRYVEYLRYLGIRSSDARLQRPEYLGGSTATIQFSEVLQTAPTTTGGTGSGGIGTMFGHGVAASRTPRYRRFFEEHGLVMCLASIRPIAVYDAPVERMWLRGMTNAGGAQVPTGLLGTREDYFVRELQHIGQQQINPMEVDGVFNSMSGTFFGWQDRYDEYRRKESRVSGQFTKSAATLDMWHFARSFSGTVALNSTFVSCVPSVLPFADQTNDNIYIFANHSIQARRMMSKQGGSFVR